MEHRKELEQEAAAAKVGISVRSARRIDRASGLPSKQEVRQWRTRADSLSRWWESDIAPLVAATHGLNAVTIVEELHRRYADEVSPVLLRTLQRRLPSGERCTEKSARSTLPRNIPRGGSD